MNTSDPKTGIQSQDRNWVFLAGVALIAISSVVVVSCFHDDDPDPTLVSDTTTPVEPDPINVTGTSLFCEDANVVANLSTAAAGTVVDGPDSIQIRNVSFSQPNESWNNHNAGNNLKRMTTIVAAVDPSGEVALDENDEPIGDVHPLLVSYGEQVIGGYEGGDGSADIGDPDNIDDIFVSLSLDNGQSWKKMQVGDTAKNASSIVTWNSTRIPYPGHSHKPMMGIEGDNILVAWNDKFCPSGDPFDLVDDEGNLIDPEQPDTYKVNGSQGTIDYGGIVAPNGKLLYEVPFSCVWTARGVLVDVDTDGIEGNEYQIQWRAAQQMTSGTRDSNKIWIASEDVGFAISWQEDTEGLRSGKGLGPGEGYSGATTNHGTDIWYTYITIDDFVKVCAENDTECDIANAVSDPELIAAYTTKPKPAVNYAYPVRITNNEVCSSTDTDPDTTTKLWCVDHCESTVSVTSQSGSTNDRCVQNDLDYLTPDTKILPAAAILDGDTGASRPAMKILKTNAAEPEFVTILAYEETKGLSESDPQDQGDTDIDIALEGKAVYFESFFWDQPVAVSAGRIVNLRVPEVVIADDGSYTETDLMIYENARRVVIMPQVDACEMAEGDPTFALLYKQGYDTQGGPSDMFIRVNYGFTYDDFGLLDGRDVTNVSAHDNEDAENGTGQVIWDASYLDHQSYEQPFDNTFSPRGWLRGAEVYNGFEFSPRWKATQTGTVPNNFWIHRYVDSAWQGPMQLSIVTGERVSTVDPKFIPTPRGSITSLASDLSNPNVIFLAYGTFHMDTGEELDLFYTRSTDKGATWEYLDSGTNTVIPVDAGTDRIPGTADDTASRLSMLAHRNDVLEMEVQGVASPDGTMLFDAWLSETHTYTGDSLTDHFSGLESRFGLVNFVDPATIPVP